MQEFIEKNPLLQENEIAYYESTFKGKPWYQLLYGIYSTPQEARLAAKNLPEDIRRAGPWIRSISAVQQAIKSKAAQ
jgi:DamX protein